MPSTILALTAVYACWDLLCAAALSTAVSVTLGSLPALPISKPGLPLLVHGVQTINTVAFLDHLEDERFFLFLLDAVVHQFLGDGRRDHQDAVGVGNNDVSRLNCGTTAGDGDVRIPRNVPATKDCRVRIRKVR